MAEHELGVLEFVANSVELRVAHYRDRATHLRSLAEAEPVAHLREKLVELAAEFEALANSLTISPAAPKR
jgi:hypothetical protein